MARQYAFESSWDHPVPKLRKKLSGAAKKNRNFKTDSEPITIIVIKQTVWSIRCGRPGCGIGRYDNSYRYLGDGWRHLPPPMEI